MRLVNEKQRSDRITSILNAAEKCFARSGFHGSTVQQICAEAGMSQGNLYRYFPSKEALVAGLCQRDMEMLAADIETVVRSANTVLALGELARNNLLSRSWQELALWVETSAEATRNPAIAEITTNANRCVQDGLTRIFQVALERGEIPPGADIARLVSYAMTVFMGLVMRRVKDPDFDIEPILEMQSMAMQTLSQSTSRKANSNHHLKVVP